MNIYNKSKQTSTNDALRMDVNIILWTNTNSSSSDRKEGTDLDTLSDFTKKNLILEI